MSLFATREVVLVTGDLPKQFARYPLVVRYGFAYLYAEDDFLIVTQVYDDHQRQHFGLEAVDFVESRGARFPRSDAIGYRVSDLKYREDFIRNLDIARPLFAFAFMSDALTEPFSIISKTIWATTKADGLEQVPDHEDLQLSLLGKATTCYAAHPTVLTDLPNLLN